MPYLLALLLFANPAFAASSAELLTPTQKSVGSVELTSEEKAWLLSHKKIIVAFDDSVPPYSFINKSGQFEGMAVDILNAIGQKLGIVFHTFPRSSWPQLFTAAVERRVDVIAAMVDRPERHLWFNFTHPYLTKSLVIMTHKSDLSIHEGDDLSGKKVALVKGYSFSDRIISSKKRTIKTIFVNSMQSCLKAVEEKKADACITYIGTAQYFLSRNQLANVKFAGFYERKTSDESIAVRNDWPILAGILQKGLDSLSESEMKAVYLKWSAVESKNIKSDFGLLEISDNPAVSEFSSNKDHDRPLIAILPYFFMIGYIWLWLLLLKGYRQNTRKQIPETESADQSLEILKCDFEQMILKRATELNTHERKFRNLVETLNKDYFFYQRDNQGKMTYVSPAVTSVLGYQPERFSSDFRYFLTNNRVNKKLDTLLNLSVQGIPFPPQQLELFDAENNKRWIEIAETPLYDEYGNCTGVQGLVFDITQRKLEEEKLIWLAFHDELTSLPNRRQFIDRLQQAIPLSNRNCMPFAVLYFCLDNLSNIIDEMGHGTADYLIREISKRLTGSIRESDLAARIGEDEFALLLPETDLPASATVAQNIIRNLYAPISFGLDSIQLNTHIGIALYPRHGSDSEKLLQYADASMYYAKKKHLGYSSVIET